MRARNSGGVISSYAEYIGVNPQNIFEMIEEKIVRNVTLVIKKSHEENKSPRDQSLKIAQERVAKAMISQIKVED